MHLNHLRAFAASFLAVCLLSACASGPTKTSSPPPSPTAKATTIAKPSSAVTSSKAGPVTPDLATLTAAAKAYFEAHNRAIRTQDTKAFRRTFTDRCKICTTDASELDGYTRLGQKLRGGDYHMMGAKLLKAVPGGGIVYFSVTQDPSTLSNRAGRTVRKFDGGKAPNTYFEIAWVSNAWMVTSTIVSS